ncbi:MAG: flagellar biosynthetic protein FliR [Gammaproteobacteria bacterium]|nr:flagellar biosynthetic protein FliR [Gammaproteobacteria bacterium]NNJ95835.1 flagellar biosynthetic protein FliR [Gammaproteobacteria bacterium]
MSITGTELTGWLASLLWPLIRIGAMFAALPIFSARSVPVRIRVLLAFFIAWILLPVIPKPPVVDLISAQALLISVYQVLIGVAMGFILQMVFSAFVIAGQSIAMAMGLGFASIIDPQNGVQVPVVSQAFLIMVTLVFLALNGHLLLIEVLADSFQRLPVGPVVISQDGLWQLVTWGSNMFLGGMLVALPAVAALLLVNLAFGVASRAAPQLNIFAVGFPVMILVGLAFIILTLPSITDHLSRMMLEAINLINKVV